MTDRSALLAANAAFYDAFARGDLAAMCDVWAGDDGISCIHPGWPALFGRDAVLASWCDILGAGRNDITFRDPHPFASAAEGRVLCVEAIRGQLLQATNHFRVAKGSWRLVHHQASPISHFVEPSVVPEGTWLN